MSFPPVIDLDDLALGRGGLKLVGQAEGDQTGLCVSAAGDVNGDGIDDIVIGAPMSAGGGAAYVVFGRRTGFPAILDLDEAAAGSGGFRLWAASGDAALGRSVAAAGDLNGDGRCDLVIGAPGGADGAGLAFVVYGRTGGFGSGIDLDGLLTGEGGFVIEGATAGGEAGFTVSGAGDVNGDGLADLVIGAPGVDAAWVVHGRAGGFPGPVSIGAIAAGEGGFLIEGANPGSGAGFSVRAAGDVNGDGRADLVVGAPFDDAGGAEAGAAYLLFGTAGSRTSPVDLAALAAGDGFKIQGQAAGDLAGFSVSGAGDLNADGVDDLVIGAETHAGGGNGAGAAYVLFGRTGGFAATIDLDDIAGGSGGFRIQGQRSGDLAGVSVAAAGDVNGDGIDDLVIGATGDDGGGSGAGAAYVVYGQPTGFPGLVDLDDVAAGQGGFKIRGERAGDRAGISVSAAGDLNDDGIDDLLIGAPTEDAGGELAGAAYVLFGRREDGSTPLFSAGADMVDLNTYDLSAHTTNAATLALGGADTVVLSATQNIGLHFEGNGGSDTVTGSAAGDRISGDEDADTLTGGNGGDTLWGGEGSDRLSGNAGPDSLLGGTGDDSLDGAGGNDAVAGGDGHDRLAGGAGRDSLIGEGGNDRLWGGDDIDQLAGGNGADTLVAGGGNDSLDGGTGNDSLAGDGGNDTLDGGPGIDRIAGGPGADRFAFGRVGGAYPDGSSTAAPNVIADFLNGTARFLIDRSATGINDFAGDVVRTQVGADVRLTFQNDANATRAVVLLLTETVANVDASDFIFLA